MKFISVLRSERVRFTNCVRQEHPTRQAPAIVWVTITPHSEIDTL